MLRKHGIAGKTLAALSEHSGNNSKYIVFTPMHVVGRFVNAAAVRAVRAAPGKFTDNHQLCEVKQMKTLV